MKRIVADLETDGLYDKVTKIHCIAAVDIDTGEENLWEPGEIHEGLDYLASADLIAGHNWSGYDHPVLLKLTDGFQFTTRHHDTLAMSRMLTLPTLRDSDFKRKNFPKNLVGAHSLEAWGHRLGVKKGDFHHDADWSHYTPAMGEYCLQDVHTNLELYKFLIGLQRKGLHTPLEAFEVESRIHNICFEVQQLGLGFDEQGAAKVYSKLLGKREELREDLQDLFPPIAVSQGLFTPKRDNARLGYAEGCSVEKIKMVEFNPASDMQIAMRLKKEFGWEPKVFTEKGQARVDATVLGRLPFEPAKKIAEFKEVNKKIGAIADGNAAYLRISENGIIHGRTNAFGARTGRMSASGPNTSNIDSDLKYLFRPATPGYIMMDVDLSGIELRLLANRMVPFDDGEFCEVVSSGDPHALFQSFTGIKDRNLQKTCTYALLYGSGNVRLGSVVAKDMGIEDASDAKLAKMGGVCRESIMTHLPAFKKLVTVCEKAHATGWMKLLDGRFVKSQSQHSALNTLIQGDGCVVFKNWVLDFYDRASTDFEQGDWGIQALVHDEILCEARSQNHADMLGQCAVGVLQQTRERLGITCPLDAEYETGRTWGEVH